MASSRLIQRAVLSIRRPFSLPDQIHNLLFLYRFPPKSQPWFLAFPYPGVFFVYPCLAHPTRPTNPLLDAVEEPCIIIIIILLLLQAESILLAVRRSPLLLLLLEHTADMVRVAAIRWNDFPVLRCRGRPVVEILTVNCSYLFFFKLGDAREDRE